MPNDLLNQFVDVRGPQRFQNGRPFNSGEHLWIGDEGAANACRERHFDTALLASTYRLDKNVRLSYGEIVALSGDFYASPDELFDETSSIFSGIYESKDISDLQEMFQIEMAWIRNDAGKTATNYPDQNLRMWWNCKGYLELALANVAHFGWHNMVKYVEYHAQALFLAAGAMGKNNDTFRRAVYTNGFADHFLTDAFAAGHVRVPRREICDWLGKGDEKLAGALSKLLHDQDGHVATLHSDGEKGRPETDGLAVTNARGERWFTRCDGQLFLPPEADQTPTVKLPVAAVAASVGELLEAWKKNVLPTGPYAATALVAFPDPNAPKLIEKFAADSPDAFVAKLNQSVSWYSKVPWLGPGLNEAAIRRLLKQLPDLMESFRQNIARDLDEDPNLATRLAAGYVAGYRGVA